jgi:FtsH-binding integral membrane protein
VALTPFGHLIYASPLRWVIVFAPLAFVLLFGARAASMSAATARIMFLSFAALMGLSMSFLLMVYTGGSIARVFFITSASFGGLSLYGYLTKRDLSPVGSFLIMGVWGLVIAGIVNIFLQSTNLQFGLSIIAVLVFAGLTAYDTQMIKDQYYESDGYEISQKKSVFGALQLYLDFVNMFQSLLYLFGQRNN